MGNSQNNLDETIDQVYYSLPKTKKENTNHAAASLFFSGGGRRKRKKEIKKVSRVRSNNHHNQIVCPVDGRYGLIEENMDESMQIHSTTETQSTRTETEPSLESMTIIDQLIDALDLNFLSKSFESPQNSSPDDVLMLSSSYSLPSRSESSSSEVVSSSTWSPAQESSPISSPFLSPRGFTIMPTIQSSLDFAEMGGSQLSRDIAWDILFQRYIIDELEHDTTT